MVGPCAKRRVAGNKLSNTASPVVKPVFDFQDIAFLVHCSLLLGLLQYGRRKEGAPLCRSTLCCVASRLDLEAEPGLEVDHATGQRSEVATEVGIPDVGGNAARV